MGLKVVTALTAFIAIVAVVVIYVGYEQADVVRLDKQVGAPSENEEQNTHFVESTNPLLKMEVERVGDGKVKAAVYVVEFPDGSTVSVKMRPWEFPELIEIGKVADVFDEFAGRARAGDVSAALSLAHELAQCRDFGYRSEEDLRNAIASLESEHIVQLAYTDGKTEISPDEFGNVDLNYWRQELRSIYAKCQGLSQEQIFRDQEFIQLAYEAGSVPAIRLRAQALPPSEEKLSAFRLAWERGDYTATDMLRRGYRENWDGHGTNPIKEYAYGLIAQELNRIAFSDRDGRVSDFFLMLMERSTLEQNAEVLTHAEYNQAIELAKRMLADNDNCCMGLWTVESMARLPN